MAQSKPIIQNTALVAGVAVVAAGVGAVTAMLFAPKSGKELRGDIKTKAWQSKDMAQSRALVMKQKLHRTAEDMQDNIMDNAHAASGTMRDATDKLSDSAKKKIDDAAAKSQEMSEHIEEEMRRRHKE